MESDFFFPLVGLFGFWKQHPWWWWCRQTSLGPHFRLFGGLTWQQARQVPAGVKQYLSVNDTNDGWTHPMDTSNCRDILDSQSHMPSGHTIRFKNRLACNVSLLSSQHDCWLSVNHWAWTAMMAHYYGMVGWVSEMIRSCWFRMKRGRDLSLLNLGAAPWWSSNVDSNVDVESALTAASAMCQNVFRPEMPWDTRPLMLL